MCTLTWWNGPGRYDVFFNRDELCSRGRAEPPLLQCLDGVRFLAPVDRPSGGTWLLANEAGVTLAILNLYEKELPEIPGAAFRSRGLLLRGLADCESLEEVAGRLGRNSVSLCNAFTLLGFDQGGPEGFRVWRWTHDRERLSGPELDPTMPICSSSFAAEQVIAARRRAFQAIVPPDRTDPERLLAFHHDDNRGQPSAETVLMRRTDARTLSISRVRVAPERVCFEYEEVPEEGGTSGAFASVELDRT
ncbi:MAG: Transport and Golgi organization 2 [Verrucomicrobia bacterium]|nr:MAG: Transport and Golgi organization 2 [Verrucomicrobiota bacterium]